MFWILKAFSWRIYLAFKLIIVLQKIIKRDHLPNNYHMQFTLSNNSPMKCFVFWFVKTLNHGINLCSFRIVIWLKIAWDEALNILFANLVIFRKTFSYGLCFLCINQFSGSCRQQTIYISSACWIWPAKQLLTWPRKCLRPKFARYTSRSRKSLLKKFSRDTTSRLDSLSKAQTARPSTSMWRWRRSRGRSSARSSAWSRTDAPTMRFWIWMSPARSLQRWSSTARSTPSMINSRISSKSIGPPS